MHVDEPNGEPEESMVDHELEALISAVTAFYPGAFSVAKLGDQVQLATPSGVLCAAHSTHGDSAALLTSHLTNLAHRHAAGHPSPLRLHAPTPQSATFTIRAFKDVKLDKQ